MLSAHLGDLADTTQLKKNTLSAVAMHITNRIKKLTVVLNAAADRRDRACSSKVMNSKEVILKCFSWKGGIQHVNTSGHQGWGSSVPCGHLCPSATGSMCPGRIYRRCQPDARSPTALSLTTAGKTEKMGRAGGRQKNKEQGGDMKIAAMHHFFLYFQYHLVVYTQSTLEQSKGCCNSTADITDVTQTFFTQMLCQHHYISCVWIQ